MAVIHERLEGLTGAEFAKAERLYRWASRTQVAIAVLAAGSIFLIDTTTNVMAAAAALILYVVWSALDWSYRDSRGQAERGRRALLIADGLGGCVSPGEMRDVEAHFSVSEATARDSRNPEFFASERAVGEARLTELIEESGFYSCRLYRLSATWAWSRFVVAGFIALILLISSVTLMDVEQLALGARLVCTVLIFLVGQDVLGAARAYMRAHEALASLQARVRAVRQVGYPKGDLLLLLGDYNSAVEGAPLMAPGVYKREAARLDALWRAHQEQKSE